VFVRCTTQNRIVIETAPTDPPEKILKQKISPLFPAGPNKWVTDIINLLIIGKIFQVEYSEQASMAKTALEKRFEFIRAAKQSPYSQKIPLLKPETELLPHQLVGVNWLLTKNTLLADDMGLGKTIQATAAACVLLHSKKISRIMIVCPNTVKYNWLVEIKKFSVLDPHVLESNKEKAIIQLEQEDHEVLITNYEALQARATKKIKDTTHRYQLALSKYIDRSDTLIVLDEAHRIKNVNAKVTMTVQQWSKPKKMCLTGTPVDQHPEDVFSIFKFLDGGKLLGVRYNDFIKQYCLLDYSFSPAGTVCGYKHLDKLRFLMSLNMLRRTKDQANLNLPEKIYKDWQVLPTPEQAKYYAKLQAVIKAESKSNPFREYDPLVYLVQAVSNPFLVKKPGHETQMIGAKMDVLDSILLEKIELSKEKVVVWTNFVNNFPVFMERYKKYNPVMIDGSVPVKERQEIIDRFQNFPNNQVMFCNPQAASTGITITAASVAVFYDRMFKISQYQQAVDRIHRIGQSKTCLIINLIMSGTIDEAISYGIEDKTQLAEYLQSR
jgi:SNF2 family DNA or RNA helicase